MAEHYISIHKYETALSKYFDVGLNSSMFSIDIHNALVCAIYSEDEKAIKFFGVLLAEKGLPEAYFLNKSVFKDLKLKKYWIEIANLSQVNYNKKFKEIAALNVIVDSVLLVDSFYNSIRIGKDLAADTVWINNNYHKYDTIIKLNAKYLAETFEKMGFPSDDYPYFYLRNDTTLSFRPIFSEPIIHSYQGKSVEKGRLPKIDTFFTPTLRKAFDENKISAYSFANLQDMGNLNMDFRKYYATNHMFIKSNDEFYASPYYFGEQEIRDKININRVEIGLPTLEVEINKIKYYNIVGQNLGFIFFKSYNTYKGFEVSKSYLKL
jgi:hypothetical protein